MSNLVESAADANWLQEDDNEALHQYLIVTLNEDIYALAILKVKEIVEFGRITTVPMMPAFIRGVMNLRGLVVPVIDLAARFGNGATEVRRRTSVVIVEVTSLEQGKLLEIGIMVDAVNEVVEIPPEHVEPPPAFGSGLRTDFIAGMAKRQDKFLIVLDIERVLSVQEMSDVAKAALAGGGQA